LAKLKVCLNNNQSTSVEATKPHLKMEITGPASERQTRNENRNQRRNRAVSETDDKWKEEIKKKELEMQEMTAKYKAVCKDLNRYKHLESIRSTPPVTRPSAVQLQHFQNQVSTL